jgi:hypothetical protein
MKSTKETPFLHLGYAHWQGFSWGYEGPECG